MGQVILKRPVLCWIRTKVPVARVVGRAVAERTGIDYGYARKTTASRLADSQRHRAARSPGKSPPPPEVRDGAEDGVERGVQMFAEVFGEEAQDEAAVFLEQGVLAAVAAVGRGIG